jgi:hypothetical protein
MSSDHYHYDYASTNHDHRGQYAEDSHDHYDYAERHHRHYDDETTAAGLREDLGHAEARIRELEAETQRLQGGHREVMAQVNMLRRDLEAQLDNAFERIRTLEEHHSYPGEAVTPPLASRRIIYPSTGEHGTITGISWSPVPGIWTAGVLFDSDSRLSSVPLIATVPEYPENNREEESTPS